MTDQTPLRKGRKIAQVLAGAQEVFLRDGYERASVDDIARAASVSKATLYSYFPDKRLLFLEVATAQCRRQAREALATIDPGAPPHEVLPQVGRCFLEYLFSDFGQRIFRICVAETDRFPEIARAFYRFGPGTMHEALTAYLTQARARGEIEAEDINLAADQFAELCKADLWPKLLFGVRDQITPDDITRVVDGAVTTFMARYGAERRPDPLSDQGR